MFSYLTTENVFDAFKKSKTYMRPLFEPFEEFERIARNRPHPSIDKAYPKTTDGTTASIVQKTPRRVIQQIPTGVFKSDTEDWLSVVAGFIYTSKILPMANAQYELIQKCWSACSKSLTFGSQPAYIPWLQKEGTFSVDLTLPYVKDVFLEPGKLSDKDSNYIFMRSWYQPADIKAIINRESKLKDSESGWDIEALKEIEDKVSQKDDLSVTPNEKNRNNRNGGVEIIHAFQKGIGAEFYSFHLSTEKIVRTKKNKDPRGKMPIHYLYSDIDMSNPLGRGFVELVAPMQNLMDAEVQMYQYNRALMLNPPIIKKGNWSKSQAKLVPNTIWDLGSDEKASAEPLTIDTSAIANFPQNYGLMKSQLLNLLSSPDTSISAEVGNPGFSKTDAGVKTRENILNVDDNYLRKQFEAWFEDVSETMVNLYFAERSGVEEIQLDDDTANKLKATEGFDSSKLGDDNKIRIDFDTETPKLKFTIDASTSNMKDNQDQVEKATNLLELTMKYPQLDQKQGGPVDATELTDRIVVNSGIEDPEKVVPKPDANGEQQQEQPPTITPDQVQQMIDEALQQSKANDVQEHPIIKLMTSLNIKFAELPQDSQEEVLKLIGIPTNMLTPTTANIALKANAQSHDILNNMAPQPAPTDSTQPQSKTGQQPQQPQSQQPQDQANPQDDQAYLDALQQHGLTPEQSNQALVMLHSGYQVDQVLSMLGAN